ncbi:MAG TPA: BMP family ABC transporter substrate-binding protein [Bacilli bacterium]|nr:BMP family ABC transporter substrate-binding protein [Bacilli bacterium]
MKRAVLLLFIITLVSIATACIDANKKNKIKRVGLLTEDTIDDQGWNSKGYEGLLQIQASLGVDVFLKEEVDSFIDISEAIEEFEKEGVNLIFGHGRLFAEAFNELNDQYPHIHFVSFNGEVEGENVTSLHFNGYAMGFFAGMFAAEMTETNEIGVIGAESWQPEISGFTDGAKFINPQVETSVELVGDWSNSEIALEYFYQMKEKGVDVFYPCGDGFNVPVIEEVKKYDLFSIGFINDFSDIGGISVLTSTVQHVEKLYEIVAQKFNEGTLESGNLYYDFEDGVISLGPFSSVVSDELKKKMDEIIQHYIENGKLPNEL